MSLPPIITSNAFKAGYSRYGFSQAEAGAREVLNGFLVEDLNTLTRQAMLQADHKKHSGLSRDDAQKAVEMSPEIPNGIY